MVKMQYKSLIKKVACIILSLSLISEVRSHSWGFAGDVASYVFSCYPHFFSPYTCERCNHRWIGRNTTGLQSALNKKLYGQHLVLQAVVNHIKAHVNNKDPPKALALSFHGGTGTGKNYVSKIIADHVFHSGLKSNFVHLISVTKEFPHEEMLHFYKDQLRNWIETNVTKCKYSIFIFDEMDKMPAGLLDTIKPYLDYYEELAGINYRHAIFLFLSNTAGNAIIQYTHAHWLSGKPRTDMKLKEIEQIITKEAVNADTHSGLWHSELIAKHLITAFVPFLPLEKEHVRRCIKDALVSRKFYKPGDKIPEAIVNEVLEELIFFPEDTGVYSVTGCKRVTEKVDYVMTN